MKNYDSEEDYDNLEESDRYPIRNVIKDKAKRQVKNVNSVDRPNNHKEYNIMISKSNLNTLIFIS